jgi:hypothetical protein
MTEAVLAFHHAIVSAGTEDSRSAWADTSGDPAHVSVITGLAFTSTLKSEKQQCIPDLKPLFP